MEEAREFIGYASQLDSTNIDVLLVHAKLLRMEKRRREEAEICLRIAKLRPDWHQGFGALNLIPDELGAYEEAILAYDRSLALNPNRAAVFNNLGAAHRALGPSRGEASMATRGRDRSRLLRFFSEYRDRLRPRRRVSTGTFLSRASHGT